MLANDLIIVEGPGEEHFSKLKKIFLENAEPAAEKVFGDGEMKGARRPTKVANVPDATQYQRLMRM